MRNVYVPPHFRFDDVPELQAYVARYDFGILITPDPRGGGPTISHIPFHLDPGCGELGTLYAHVAVANPHVRALEGGAPSVAIFTGPHAYVSPRWYADRAANVPTWNYVAVHAHGIATLVRDPERLDAIVERLAAIGEGDVPDPWTSAELPASSREGKRRGIVGIALPVDRFAGKAKLSQNRDADDRARVIAGLEATGDPTARALAEAMRANER